MKKSILLLFPLVLTGSILLIGLSDKKSITAEQNVIEIESPARPGSSVPNLHVGIDGNTYLSWVETRHTHNTLYYSTIKDDKWSNPIKISEGDNWFVNWADFPSVLSLRNGVLASHFLVETNPESDGYNINITISNDGGLSWSSPITPHRDNTPTEHGFVSMLPYLTDRFLVIWLDGRNYPKNTEMTLRSAVIDKKGQILQEHLLDGWVCSCCQTDAALASNSAIVVYRDRSENEIRDISYVRFTNGKWTNPQVLHSDNWEIAGCPVNGPAIDAKEKLVAVAWFTAANNKSKIKVAFSTDEGLTFSKPFIINEGNPLGRVDIELLHDGSALVSWMEIVGDNAYIKLRRVKQNGSLGKSIIVTKTSKYRSSGFPKMVVKGNKVYFAWTQTGKVSNIRTAYLKLEL